MKIINVKALNIPEIKVIQFERFSDHRGYFNETYKESVKNKKEVDFLKDVKFKQSNESFSKKGTIRGLHFQWNPYQGKLVRTVYGRMIDLILDIRKGSPNFGQIIAHKMFVDRNDSCNEWIWVPEGFAHGNFFLDETIINYRCTGEYNRECESGISPLSADIDWSMCDNKLKKLFFDLLNTDYLISEKDKQAQSLEEWEKTEESNYFKYK